MRPLAGARLAAAVRPKRPIGSEPSPVTRHRPSLRPGGAGLRTREPPPAARDSDPESGFPSPDDTADSARSPIQVASLGVQVARRRPQVAPIRLGYGSESVGLSRNPKLAPGCFQGTLYTLPGTSTVSARSLRGSQISTEQKKILFCSDFRSDKRELQWPGTRSILSRCFDRHCH
jgi:hypothetical protein